MRIVVVGAGVSGLVAAYYLSRQHEVWVFEKESWAGGHAHTVCINDGTREFPVDVGFLVYNERNYPVFSRLLTELEVPTLPTEMSFSVQCHRCRVEYASHDVPTALGRPKQWIQPSHWATLASILRFHRIARNWRDWPHNFRTLEEFLKARKFPSVFFRHYLGPMAAAIWSAPTANIKEFPLSFLLEFLENHGLLTLNNQPQWRTIAGGSREYVRRLVQPFASRLHLRQPVDRVLRKPSGVEIHVRHCGTVRADAVVLAVHANQALDLLADATDTERNALSAIPYQANVALLHRDSRLLPRSPRHLAAWNYHVDDCRSEARPVTITYSINRLQQLPTQLPVCVTLNGADKVDPNKVWQQWTFEHPQYRSDASSAQATLFRLSGQNRTYFCGAYMGFGFHEDGAKAGLHVALAFARSQEAA